MKKFKKLKEFARQSYTKCCYRSASISAICGKKSPKNRDKSEYLLRDSDRLSVNCPVELNPDLVDKDSEKHKDQK